jgi:GNAT superfamily N-acetyltransferase
MPVTVRKANARDGPSFLSLVRELALYEKLEPPDEKKGRQLLKDAFQRKRFSLLMAFVDGKAAGYAIYFNTYSSFLARPTLYIEDIFVKEEYRQQGVGGRMMFRLIKEALRTGCGRMEWIVLDWNTNAIRFYEKLGAKMLPQWKLFRMDREQMERLADKN